MKPTTDFPFLLDNPRAWRTYLGGRMLDALAEDKRQRAEAAARGDFRVRLD